MSQPEFLKSDQADIFLRKIVNDGLCGTLSCLRGGKWYVYEILGVSCGDPGLCVRIVTNNVSDLDIKKDQPVGICFQYEHSRYIFESPVSVPPGFVQPCELILEMPDKIEIMPRRVYERQAIPNGMKVRALFWHRGFQNASEQSPDEDYWQGKLENLSAGGAMIRVEPDHRDFFSMGQLVGVQFTPMSYQKPLLLEGHVRHLQSPPGEDALLVGVEFLGLEASPEGRETLHRLLEVIDIYEKMNLNNPSPPDS